MVKQTNSRQANRTVTGMSPSEYDKVIRSDINSFTERYVFYLDDNLVGVITLIYTSSARTDLDEVIRTNAL